MFFTWIVLSAFVLCGGCRRTADDVSQNAQNNAEQRESNKDAAAIVSPENEPQRIISTVPSVTEVLFALGLGNRVVGVSRFCRYPKEVEKLPDVGGLFDPNDEALLELRPDLVILLSENVEREERIKSFGVSCLKVDHRSIEGIIDSFARIGNRCGAESAKYAVEWRRNIRERLDAIVQRTAALPKRSALITLYDESDTTMQSAIIAASNPFFHRAIELAGGVNAAKNIKVAFPTVSGEGILELNPDIVIGIASREPVASQSAALWEREKVSKSEAFVRDWERFAPFSPAVKNHRVVLIREDYAVIPGPRFILFVEQLAEILHPSK
ncbi:MAG: helical backbone metal receptor [Planctomycetaceae bacterium]|nr:helical backbone metal receptor [Planctomycetaceae bacterium]